MFGSPFLEDELKKVTFIRQELYPKTRNLFRPAVFALREPWSKFNRGFSPYKFSVGMYGAILILLGPCVSHTLDHMTLLIDIRVFLQVESRLEVGVRARLEVITLNPRNVPTRFSCACVCVCGRGEGVCGGWLKHPPPN